MTRSHFATIAAAACTLALSHGTAHADAAGDAALASVDAAGSKAASFHLIYEAVTTEPGKPERKAELHVFGKGDKRLIEFRAPADMKGTKVLILSPTQMYVYLPAFGKVRRITTALKDQTFLGMPLTVTELAGLAKFSPEYTAVVKGSTDTDVALELSPKADQKPACAKVELTVSKDKNLPTEIKCSTADGKLAKSDSRSGYTCQGAVCGPGQIKVVGHSH